MNRGNGKRKATDGREVSPPTTKRRQQSTTTSKAVASFFTPASKKEPEKMIWRVVKDSLLIGRYNTAAAAGKSAKPPAKRKIVAFDFDSTLITSASGKKFGRDATDWKWWHGSVPETLRKLYEDGYLVTVVSNQAGISLKPDPKTVKSDQKRLADFKGKVSAVLRQLDLPISVYAAIERDRFRKPRTGIWHELLNDYDLKDAVDLESSVFVGDAGGRDAAGSVPKDHSCVDRDFAANCGIPFKTPEEYFLQEDARPFVRQFDPSALLAKGAVKAADATVPFSKTNELDIVLFCGSPGAGKSSYYWRFLQPLGYARINQDILKTRDKCLHAATALVLEGTSVCVDNTNADPETRAYWVALAKKLNVPIRCIHFTAPVKLCEHNDTVRALNIGPNTNPEKRAMLPKMAFTGFAARFRKPELSEGFADVTTVNFELEGTEEHKKLWAKYWL